MTELDLVHVPLDQPQVSIRNARRTAPSLERHSD